MASKQFAWSFFRFRPIALTFRTITFTFHNMSGPALIQGSAALTSKSSLDLRLVATGNSPLAGQVYIGPSGKKFRPVNGITLSCWSCLRSKGSCRGKELKQYLGNWSPSSEKGVAKTTSQHGTECASGCAAKGELSHKYVVFVYPQDLWS